MIKLEGPEIVSQLGMDGRDLRMGSPGQTLLAQLCPSLFSGGRPCPADPVRASGQYVGGHGSEQQGVARETGSLALAPFRTAR